MWSIWRWNKKNIRILWKSKNFILHFYMYKHIYYLFMYILHIYHIYTLLDEYSHTVEYFVNVFSWKWWASSILVLSGLLENKHCDMLLSNYHSIREQKIKVMLSWLMESDTEVYTRCFFFFCCCYTTLGGISNSSKFLKLLIRTP